MGRNTVVDALFAMSMLLPFCAGCQKEERIATATPWRPASKPSAASQWSGDVLLRLKRLEEQARGQEQVARRYAQEALASSAAASEAETGARRSAAAGDAKETRRYAALGSDHAGHCARCGEKAAAAAANGQRAASEARMLADGLAQPLGAHSPEAREATSAAERAQAAATAAKYASNQAERWSTFARDLAASAQRLAANPVVTAKAPSQPPPGARAEPNAPEPVPPVAAPEKPAAVALASAKPLPTSAPAADVPPSRERFPVARPDANLPVPAADRRPGVDMRTVPDVPNLPLLDVRPKGILLASSRPAAPVSLADTEWVQTSAGSEADFLPGGYKRNAIVFHGDGTVEVTRSYIGDGEILRKWRIGGQLDLAKGNLELGQDQDRRPADSSLKGQDLREMDSSVVPATTGLPVKLKVRRVSQDMMELDGKTYRRVSPKR